MHYYADIWAIVLEVLQLQDDDYGLLPQVVAATEERLGAKMPESLSAFYLQFGKQPQLLQAHARFANPNELYVMRGGLVFCKECQGSYFWAVELNSQKDVDVPVVQGNSRESIWHPYTDSMRAFLNGMACWQAIHALSSKATAPVSPEAFARIQANYSRIESTSTGPNGSDLHGYYTEGLMICAFPKQNKCYVAAHEDSTLMAFEQECKLPLSWL